MRHQPLNKPQTLFSVFCEKCLLNIDFQSGLFWKLARKAVNFYCAVDWGTDMT